MWYTISTKEVEKQMQTNIEFGLNEKQVEDKQNKFGLNKLEEKNKESIFIGCVVVRNRHIQYGNTAFVPEICGSIFK